MNLKKVELAEREAKRFLEKVKELKKRAKIDIYAFHGCKETGSVKRSSMDLSRSLSELRKTD